MLNELENLGIRLKGNRNQQKVKCPRCSEQRRKKSDTPLSVNIEEGTYNCHHCGWKGCVGNKKKQEDLEYTKPNKSNITKLNDSGLKLFTDRGISQKVVQEHKIAMSKDKKFVVFPYLVKGELINTKSRGIKEKDFRQSAGAKPVMYNYDNCVGEKEIIICEGEFDVMAFNEAGFKGATSVNQGAPNENDKNVSKKLECITNCYDIFEKAEIVYLATDNDPNGKRLQDELVRRIGAEKCKLVDFGDHKDANDLLIKEGALELLEVIKNAKFVKIDGIFEAEDVWEEMQDGYNNGKERGTTTYFPDIDRAWTWRPGEVTVWTGYQNEGKSLMLNQLSLVKAIKESRCFAEFTPENMPISDFFDDLIEMYVGKSCDPYYEHNLMSKEEYEDAYRFVNKHFFVIYPNLMDFRIDVVLERAKWLVRRKGVQDIIIDPYNTIHHEMRSGEREDLYICRFMDKLKNFAVMNRVGVHLVAHQVTPRKDSEGRYPKPDINYIKGGGSFGDKADNVVYVHRPDRAIDFSSKEVVFGSQKIKKQKLVGIPQDVMGIIFDVRSQRYFVNGHNPMESHPQITPAPDFYDANKGIEAARGNEFEEEQTSFNLDD
jgi:twinkle protein